MNRPVALAALWLLAVVGVGAVWLVHRIESTGSPVGRPTVTPAFSPDGDGRRDIATITFTVRGRERVTAQVLDRHNKVVQTLARRESVRGRTQLQWDGSARDGLPPDGSSGNGAFPGRAAEGHYRVRLRLQRADRTFVVPSPIRLDTTAPRIGFCRFDTTRVITNRVIRAEVELSGAREYFFQVDGKRLSTVRVVRDKRISRGEARQRFRISARLPQQTSGKQVTVVFVAVDWAGNRTVREESVVLVAVEPKVRR